MNTIDGFAIVDTDTDGCAPPASMTRYPVHKLRKEVLEFAIAMEAKLRKNDHKTGWKDQPIEAHVQLLNIEMMEFKVALEFLGDDVAAKECVDIANFALIIRDKLRARIVAAKEQIKVNHTDWAAPARLQRYAKRFCARRRLDQK